MVQNLLNYKFKYVYKIIIEIKLEVSTYVGTRIYRSILLKKTVVRNPL